VTHLANGQFVYPKNSIEKEELGLCVPQSIVN